MSRAQDRVAGIASSGGPVDASGCCRELRQAIAQQERCWEDNGGEVHYSMIVDERSITVDGYVAIKEQQYAASCHVQDGFTQPRTRTDPSWMNWFSDAQREQLDRKGLLADSDVAAVFVAQTSTTTTELSTATTLVEGDSFVAFLGDEYGIPYDENTTVAEMLAALPTPTTRYQANQYGCHSDGRCLGEDDVWCDEGDFGYPYGDFSGEPVCYPWEHETVDR